MIDEPVPGPWSCSTCGMRFLNHEEAEYHMRDWDIGGIGHTIYADDGIPPFVDGVTNHKNLTAREIFEGVR